MQMVNRQLTVGVITKGIMVGSVLGFAISTVLALVAGAILFDSWDLLRVVDVYLRGMPLVVVGGVVLGIRHFAQREKYAQMLSYVGKKQKREA
ncbi:MAG: hypothetical protein AAFR81_08445 [Chloroflexota bacterium]